MDTPLVSTRAAWLRADSRQAGRTYPLLAGALALALAFLGALGLDGARAQVAGARVTWVNATQNTDGTALTDLAGTRIQWGAPGGPYTTGQAEVAAPGQTVTVSLPGPGRYCFVATHYTTGGINSAPSPETCKTVRAPPKQPTSLTVE